MIYASLLAADKNNLEKEIDSIEPFVDGFHIDFMDGLFVPEKFYDINLVKRVWLRTRKPIEVHLMMYQPEMHFEELLNEGVERIIIHYEAAGIKQIHAFEDLAKGTCASLGFAYNPSTKIWHELMYRSYTQIMTVNPGKCGQKFDKKGLKKIKECRKYGILLFLLMAELMKRQQKPPSRQEQTCLLQEAIFSMQRIGLKRFRY